jgi:predicted transcriptional regulator
VRGFGELEAAIMASLWERGPSTVRATRDALSGRDSAYTTVMTVMDNLYRKGWLRRERQGRAWLYEPTRSREQYAAELMREALVGSGNPEGVFAHFVADIDPHDADALRRALDEPAQDG